MIVHLHMLDDLQELMVHCAKTSKHFDLTISLMKTKLMYLNSSKGDSIIATITVDNAAFPTVDK